MTSLLLAVEQAVPYAGDPTPLSARAFLAAVIVVGLVGLAAWLLRRGAPLRRGRQRITIETAMALGERRSLVIVSVEGRRLLLGLAPGHISLVTELGRPAQSDFTQTLDDTLGSGRTA